ncbi:uncharacterized protein ACWYII_027446 isoform 1-T1 [Salvelinus alpinus]
MAHDWGGPHRTLPKIQEWQQLVSDGDRSLYQNETGKATSKAMVDIFNTHGSPEVTLSDQGLVNGPTRPSRLPWTSPLIGTRKSGKVILFAHNSSIQASTNKDN